jgi:hypothetical protein
MEYKNLESGDGKNPKLTLIELAILVIAILGVALWSKYVNN